MRSEWKRTTRLKTLDVLAGVLVACQSALALINPHFTPVHLVEQSEAIIGLTLYPGETNGVLTGTVVRVFKGTEKASPSNVTIELGDMPEDEGQTVWQTVRQASPMEALLFIGASEAGTAKAFLHYGGQWAELAMRQDGIRGVTTRTTMDQTWAGSTDMLARGVEYTLTEPNPDFPSHTAAEWRLQKKICQLEGKVHIALPVRLDPKAPVVLHLGMEKGDRIYRWIPDEEDPVEITATLTLKARSICAVWGDLDSDGKSDLLSWDGAMLWLHSRRGGHTFQAQALDLGNALKDGCVSLSLIDVGTKGKPGVLVGTRGKPLLLFPSNGSWTVQPLPTPEATFLPSGQPGPLVVADLDGDSLPDVLQAFVTASLFFKGKGGGVFAPPVRIELARGDDGVPFLGDFDSDGRLDIFCAAMDSCRLWQNNGERKFTELLKHSGEAAYKCGGGAIGGATCDFNNDGRQDILVLYGDQAPQLFFNRGFRSFGDARELIPDIQQIDAEEIAQQAGCIGDFDGDGTQDMMLVMKRGELLSFMQKPDASEKVSLHLSLRPDGYMGPVTVIGYHGGFCLGAHTVTAEAKEVLIGQPGPRAVRLKWKVPGENPIERDVLMEKTVQTFVLR